MSNLSSSFRGTFRRELSNIIQNMTPYSVKDMVDLIEIDNPKFKDFYTKGSRRDEILVRHSLSQGNPYGVDRGLPAFGSDPDFNSFMYANIDPDKIKRLREYRLIAAYDIVSTALDEICDEFIVKNSRGEIFNVEISDDKKLGKQAVKTIRDEFKKFIKYFEFDYRGWEYCRNILIDGELFFEHIIHEDRKELGILGVVSIPSESMDPIYNNVQNLLIKGFLLRKQIYDPKTKQAKEIQPIIFDKNQVTYFHYREWDERKIFRISLMEKVRRIYKQLSMIEDSFIIHRISRAPEKLVFNVDTGNMPPAQQGRYIQQLAQRFWSKKTYDSKQGAVNMFNPQSALDAFWFPKRTGSDGVQVTPLTSSMTLGDTPDLDWFIKKLYKTMNVPSGRMASDTGFSDGAEITREELHFARFIIRLQEMFSLTIKHSFITHLKLRGWWDEYELGDYDLRIYMNEPTHFNKLRNQQIFEIESNNFSAMAQNPLISETLAQKMYLGWTDEQILANREHLRRDAKLMWELTQIESLGPNWRKIEEGMTNDAAESFDPGGGLGGPPVSGLAGDSGPTPDFGPPPSTDDVGEGSGEVADVEEPQPTEDN